MLRLAVEIASRPDVISAFRELYWQFRIDDMAFY